MSAPLWYYSESQPFIPPFYYVVPSLPVTAIALDTFPTAASYRTREYELSRWVTAKPWTPWESTSSNTPFSFFNRNLLQVQDPTDPIVVPPTQPRPSYQWWEAETSNPSCEIHLNFQGPVCRPPIPGSRKAHQRKLRISSSPFADGCICGHQTKIREYSSTTPAPRSIQPQIPPLSVKFRPPSL